MSAFASDSGGIDPALMAGWVELGPVGLPAEEIRRMRLEQDLPAILHALNLRGEFMPAAEPELSASMVASDPDPTMSRWQGRILEEDDPTQIPIGLHLYAREPGRIAHSLGRLVGYEPKGAVGGRYFWSDRNNSSGR
jgi:hypothetical protein